MIPYLVVLLMILYGVIEFDIRGRRRNRSALYWGIMLYLALLSGLAYRLGGDGMSYVNEFAAYPPDEGFGWAALTGYQGRMPGWVFLNKFFRLLSPNFALFKLFHAFLLNILFFSGIRYLTKWRFSCVLFYFVLVYFDFNFQLLRQSIAVGFFLNAIPYLGRRKWKPYYLLCLIGLVFHESILVALVLPFFRNLKINKRLLVIFSAAVALIIVFSTAFAGKIVALAAALSQISPKIGYYAAGIQVGLSFSFITNVLLNVAIPVFFIHLFVKQGRNRWIYLLVLAYLLIYTMGLYIPILYRINQYFLLIFYAFYIEIFAYVGRWIRRVRFGSIRVKPGYAFILLCLCFLLFKARMYQLPYGDTGYPSYAQYYPYASIVFQKTDPLREALLSSL